MVMVAQKEVVKVSEISSMHTLSLQNNILTLNNRLP
jgi:hypothetical protein